jgi:hypothetical protein
VVRDVAFDRRSWRPHLAAWCEEHLGAPPARVLFVAGWQSAAVGVELPDRARVVVKVRPPAVRLDACFTVQRALWESGFPCPEPLVSPTPLGRYAATAERHVGGGRIARTADAGAFARLLAELVRLAPAPSAAPPLDPPPPWARWDHGGPGLWPAAAPGEIDLDRVPDPPALRTVVERAQARLEPTVAGGVVGHLDWESQNIRWRARRPHVVHDWDSLCVRARAAVVGCAAAVFPADDRGVWFATVGESAAFHEAYARCDPAWCGSDEAVAWAAGLWVRAYNVKGSIVRGERAPLARFLAEAPERLERAGA